MLSTVHPFARRRCATAAASPVRLVALSTTTGTVRSTTGFGGFVDDGETPVGDGVGVGVGFGWSPEGVGEADGDADVDAEPAGVGVALPSSGTGGLVPVAPPSCCSEALAARSLSRWFQPATSATTPTSSRAIGRTTRPAPDGVDRGAGRTGGGGGTCSLPSTTLSS